jgi:hypothetical protein
MIWNRQRCYLILLDQDDVTAVLPGNGSAKGREHSHDIALAQDRHRWWH